jgi:predicted ester cyclase
MHDVYAPVQVIDRDSFKKNIRALITAFPDHQLVTEQAQLQGNTISMRWVAKGTNTGPFNDMEPTDRSFKITGASFYRLEGEKIIEGWVYMDSLSMMKQLGLVPEVDEGIEEVDIYEEEIPAHH